MKIQFRESQASELEGFLDLVGGLHNVAHRLGAMAGFTHVAEGLCPSGGEAVVLGSHSPSEGSQDGLLSRNDEVVPLRRRAR